MASNQLTEIPKLDLPALQELSLENNPLECGTIAAKEVIRQLYPSLLFLNHSKMQTISEATIADKIENAKGQPTEVVLDDGPVPIRLPIFRPKNECSVVKII